ncbi:MAG TPA: prolipoprotein diacylglyceryl transferase family protein, partial [Acidimicrobiales bacterium]|nr:prolipoprotein diacylglyceryl transferase family protein [Acidimicrobiales bacterium]
MKPIPVQFHIGPLVVHTYGIGLAVTFWFAYRYFERRLRARGYPTEWVTGMFLWVVVASIVGARAVHVVANFSTYSSHPGDILSIWHGGLSSFGGLLFGIPTGLLSTRRRCPELKAVVCLDIVAPVLMAAWGIGRLLGPQLMVAGGGAPTTAWYGMYYAGETGRRVPVPIIQAIDSFVIFGVLLLIERHIRRRPTGFVVAATMALWGLARFFEEHFWLGGQAQVHSTQSESGVGPVLVQGAGLALFAAGIAVMLWLRHRPDPAASEEDDEADRAEGAADADEPSP